MGLFKISTLLTKTFLIPSYQRDYIWSSVNVYELWSDLQEAQHIKEPYFFGVIVVAEGKAYELIDGQQRILTLIMIRYALSLKVGKAELTKITLLPQNQTLWNKLTKCAQAYLNDKPQTFSKATKSAQSEGQKRLCKAFDGILDFIYWLNEKESEALLKTLDNAEVMVLERQVGAGTRALLAINERGVPLTLLERIRALLIYYSNKYCYGKLDEMINERFDELLRILTRHRQSEVENLFVRHADTFCSGLLDSKEIDTRDGAEGCYKSMKKLLQFSQLSHYGIATRTGEKATIWIDKYTRSLLKFIKKVTE